MAPKLLVFGSIFSALLCGSAYAVDPPPRDRVALTFNEQRESFPCFSGVFLSTSGSDRTAV